MSDDEFDQFFAEIDWNTIPGLSAIPLASQPSLSISDAVPAQVEPGPGPRASTPLMNGGDCTPESSQYSFDDWDAAFLTEISEAEQRALQPQPAGGLLSRTDGVAGASTRSSGSTRTSRYFHGEDCLVCDCCGTSYTFIATESLAEQVISSPHPTHFYPSTKGHHEGVNSTTSHAEDSMDRPSEPDISPTKVVHQLSSPPTREPSPKRHKGKQKESPRGLLKDFLNNFEDEMTCPMSGSEQHPVNKHNLTFTILDAVIFCKGKHACTRDSKGMNYFTASLLTWATHAVILSAAIVGGVGSRKMWVP
jgi:hypothetical protein